MQITTVQQFRDIKAGSEVETFTPEAVVTIIYLYQTYIDNRHICRTCSSTLVQVRNGLRDLYERIRGDWEPVLDEMNRQAVVDYKSQSGGTSNE